jgi:hypothetical protein
MPYRQNAESLQQILDDAIEMAMSPPVSNRRTETQRMLERIDRALALAATDPEAKPDDVLQSLRQVRDVLTLKATTGLRGWKDRSSVGTPADEAQARASPRGVQLRIIEVTLKESAVSAALIDVVRFGAQREPLAAAQRARLTASVALLRDRYESGTNLLRLAGLEPCSDLHAQLLERKLDRLDQDLKRVYDGWQRGYQRLTRG